MVIIGRSGHVEVLGLSGDLDDFSVWSCVSDAQSLSHARIGVVSQTTTYPEVAEAIVSELRRLNPDAEIRVADTICQPTRDRQTAVQELMSQVEGVVVVGGRNSNNTKQLVARVHSGGLPAWHIERATELDANWFRSIATIGLTAGTSTPDEVIDSVELALQQIQGGSAPCPNS